MKNREKWRKNLESKQFKGGTRRRLTVQSGKLNGIVERERKKERGAVVF